MPPPLPLKRFRLPLLLILASKPLQPKLLLLLQQLQLRPHRLPPHKPLPILLPETPLLPMLLQPNLPLRPPLQIPPLQ